MQKNTVYLAHSLHRLPKINIAIPTRCANMSDVVFPVNKNILSCHLACLLGLLHLFTERADFCYFTTTSAIICTMHLCINAVSYVK